MSEASETEFSVVVEDIPASVEAGSVNAGKAIHGRLIPAQKQMLLFSAEETKSCLRPEVSNAIATSAGSKPSEKNVRGE